MDKCNKIHFIGIGGIGMSGLARLYLHEGKIVSGSDKEDKPLLDALEKEGVVIYRNNDSSNVPEDADLVVYSDAVSKDNPERMHAKKLGIKEMQYFEALGDVANQYFLIAVAGTHGKTTTTAMIIDILEEASFDPTAIVGSLRVKTGSNFRSGRGKYFIAEADEYRKHFQFLRPDMLVITNIDFDHPDYFKDLEDVQNAFIELAKKVPEDGGMIIANLSDPTVQFVCEGVKAKVYDYKNAFDTRLSLPQPGLYNQLNAAAARKVAEILGVENKHIMEALENFAGTKRRFEYKGEVNEAHVYDDYAHHPTEIIATIGGVREKYPNNKLTVVFQPHTYSRTKELFDDFATALSRADRIILAPIYAAREENKSGVSSEQLSTKIKEKNPNVEFIETFDDMVSRIKDSVNKDDVVVVMGAGDVTNVAEELTK